MTLSDFAKFTTAISGLAVTASLIYLPLQTHQNAKHTKALIHQGRAARLTNLFVGFSDADRASALLVASGLTPTHEAIMQHQANQYFSSLMVGWMETFEQREAGLLSPDQFADVSAAMVLSFRRFGALQALWKGWKESRSTSHEKFKAWIAGIAVSLPATAKNFGQLD